MLVNACEVWIFFDLSALRVRTFVFQTCPAGHYCGFRTINPMECPIGTYNPKTFQKKLEHCVQCTPGKACTQTGLVDPDKSCAGGYFCKRELRLRSFRLLSRRSRN